jgi:hypothetical protein
LSFKEFVRLCAHTLMLPALESGEETLVGGQAVLEGVMMRAPHSYCIAVRRPDGEMVTDEVPGVPLPDSARRRDARPGHIARHQGAPVLRQRGTQRR